MKRDAHSASARDCRITEPALRPCVSFDMRSDMHEVIIERPRGGARTKQPKGSRRAHPRIDVEDMPRRESISKKWQAGWGGKYQTNLLGPLRRFLTSRLGQPWDQVYAELCERVDRRNTVQKHLLDHVLWEVETKAVLIDSVVQAPHSWGLRAGQFYVCPKSGRLEQMPRQRRRRKKRSTPRKFVRIDSTHQYRQIGGLWYEVTHRQLNDADDAA